MVMVIGILGIAIDTVGPWAWSSRVGVMVQDPKSGSVTVNGRSAARIREKNASKI